MDATDEPEDSEHSYGRLMNHRHTADHPNVVSKIMDIGGIPYLYFVALKDIKVGEECEYDYGDRNEESLLKCPWLAPISKQDHYKGEAIRRGISSQQSQHQIISQIAE